MKKISAMERLKSSSSLKQDKVDKLIQELNDCKKQEAEIKDSFKTASDTTKHEIARYRNERIHDLKQWMDDYVSTQIEICQKLHDAWDYIC
jgi:predicted ribosome-associated RNA-binding protein Tma20